MWSFTKNAVTRLKNLFVSRRGLRTDSYVDMLEAQLGMNMDDEAIASISMCDDLPYDLFGEYVIENVVTVKHKKQRPRIKTYPKNRIRLYIDHSNIAYGVGGYLTSAIDVEGLHHTVTHGRYVSAAYIAGSFPNDNGYWDRWDNLGYLIKRMPIGKEESVDAVLHAVILSDAVATAAHDTNDPTSNTTSHGSNNYTAVILTGDGNRNEGWSTFPDSIEALIKLGINVERWCWADRTSRIYREERFESLKIVELDDYYDREDGRFI